MVKAMHVIIDKKIGEFMSVTYSLAYLDRSARVDVLRNPIRASVPSVLCLWITPIRYVWSYVVMGLPVTYIPVPQLFL